MKTKKIFFCFLFLKKKKKFQVRKNEVIFILIFLIDFLSLFEKNHISSFSIFKFRLILDFDKLLRTIIQKIFLIIKGL